MNKNEFIWTVTDYIPIPTVLSESFIPRNASHAGPVRGLDFNLTPTELLSYWW
jgi:hypothetical protein